MQPAVPQSGAPVSRERQRQHPPRVDGVPLLGCAPQFMLDPFRTVIDIAHTHGDAAIVKIGRQRAYLLSHPDHAEAVLIEKSKVFAKEGNLWEAAQTLVGQGLGAIDGDEWQRQRTAMQPQFHKSRLADIADILLRTTQQQLDAFAATVREPFSLFVGVRRMVWRIFFRTLFNASVTDRDIDILIEATNESLAKIHSLVWTTALPPWMPKPGMRRYRQAIASLDAIIYRVIRHRLAAPTQEDDFLNLLLAGFNTKADDPHGLKKIRDQAAAMILATQEGPSLNLGWTLALIDRHPEIQEVLREEVCGAYSQARSVQEGLEALPFTKAVVEESLRLYPPLWLTMRQAKRDETAADVHIPKGSLVLINAYGIQRHPQFWSEPDRFEPQRFLDPARIPSHRGAYLPFGLGPHICIGKHYGMMFAQIFMAEFVKRFRIRLRPGTSLDVKSVVTLRPRHEIIARIERIDSSLE